MLRNDGQYVTIKGRENMNKTMIFTVVLAVMAIITVVQAFQLNGLKAELTDTLAAVKAQPVVATTTVAASAPAASGSTTLPPSLQNLPSMVGGC